MTLSTACAIVGWQHGVGNAPMGSTRNREAGIETGPEGQDGTGKKRESGSLQACRHGDLPINASGRILTRTVPVWDSFYHTVQSEVSEAHASYA